MDDHLAGQFDAVFRDLRKRGLAADTIKTPEQYAGRSYERYLAGVRSVDQKRKRGRSDERRTDR